MAFTRDPDPELHPPYLWQEPQENYYTLLHQFFDYTSLFYCRVHLKELTQGAFADEYQAMQQPGNLLYFYERLLTLLYSVHGILEESGNNSATAETNIPESDLFLPDTIKSLNWHELPHQLSLFEIHQPLNAVHSFFQFLSFDEWMLEMHDWIRAALGNSTICEATEHADLLPICTHLYKIVEAAWVLHLQVKDRPQKEREKEPPVKESGTVETQSSKTHPPAHQPENGTAILRKPSPMYFFFSEKFKPLQDGLVKCIKEACTQVQKIFLLGSTFGETRAETLFSGSAPTAREVTHCFLLVLVAKEETEKQSQLQDKLENLCLPLVATTVIVLYTEQFYDWLWERHPFAHTVQRLGVQLYSHPSLTKEPHLLSLNAETLKKEQESTYAKGINKVQEFIAGAELYTVRKQYKLAVFMLHQATEQALLTLLKVTTGLRMNTHNLDKLIRCGSMVSYRLQHIFSRKDEKGKRLFKLLQTAYSDARYDESSSIHFGDVESLSEQVNVLKEEVVKLCKKTFTS